MSMSRPGAVGARVQRLEDPRFLRGEATYVGGLTLPEMLHVGFVRSPFAHAELGAIETTEAGGIAGVAEVVTGELINQLCDPIRVHWSAPKYFENSDWPAMARDKVRFVGEIVAAVVASDRYVAEDAAELVDVDYRPLEAISNLERAQDPDAPLLFDDWKSNVVYRQPLSSGEVERAFDEAEVVVETELRMNRHCAAPMEGRAVAASYDATLDEMTVWTSSQMPHMVRTKLAELLRFPEQRLRVVAPDVGGGFGLKCHLTPEELIVTALSRRLRRPIKWVEDRAENLAAGFHGREELVSARLALRQDGTITALDTSFTLDAGAYFAYPWTPSAEPSMAASTCPGPYRVENARSSASAVVTNKSSSSVYRGVGQPAASFAIEHTLDLAASRLGIDPAEIRRRNLLKEDDFPYRSAFGTVYDSGTPLEATERALEAVGYRELRAQQKTDREQGRFRGIGLCPMMELTTFGYEHMKRIGMSKNVSAYESAHLEVDPDGGVTVAVGTHSHGQGHATTFAQLVSEVIGCDPSEVRFVQGDTARTPYGWGTWGSRSAVAGGGAIVEVAERVRDKVLRVAGHLLEASPDDLEISAGRVSVRGMSERGLTLREIARAAVHDADVPAEEEPGLEATFSYKPPTPFSNATHIAVVEVDAELGTIELQRYVVVEDCGRMINPTIVEGQITGGVAQGIGSVLLEHHQYNEEGQLLTGSLMDYLLPSATCVPPIEIDHLETPSPDTALGVKGMGEGGAVPPIAAIANAVSDAISPLCGWRPMTELPLTPEVVLGHIRSGAPK